MNLQTKPPIHLTYCLNIHPGQTWAENFAAIREKALQVRNLVCPGGRFGLGLRLSNEAATTLVAPAALAEFKEFLAANNMYVFTINGFPYGQFHGAAVKQNVYAPDWRQAERRDYTCRLATILAALLPEGVSGSISTVPISYRPWIKTDKDVSLMGKMLADTVKHLERLEESTGRLVRLALEPEPDCFIETTTQAVAFFECLLTSETIRRYVGICLDTAHAAVEFEDPAEALDMLKNAGVCVAKIQISSALAASPVPASLARLAEFCDPVYLHQVKARTADGRIISYADLPQAMEQAAKATADEQWRIHFHVPLFWDGDAELQSTSNLLKGRFAEMLRSGASGHLEIETYTFSVLPEYLRTIDVTESIAREYKWVFDNLLTV